MANIPIRDIPGTNGVPSKTTLVAMDNGVDMKKTTVQAIVEAGRITATQGEAETGTDNLNVMTALRVKQSIVSEVGSTIASATQGALASTALQPAAIGTTVQAHSAVLDATTASYTTAEESKLSGIETGADVTDAANVTAAGAAMTANNLSDLGSASTALDNLGFGASGKLIAGLGALGSAGQVVAVNGAADGVLWLTPSGGGGSSAYVTSVTSLKGLSTASVTAVYLSLDGRSGWFRFQSGDYSTEITADINEGIYIKADDTAAASGAWVRVYEGYANIDWFGATPYPLDLTSTSTYNASKAAAAAGTDSSSAIEAAMAVVNAITAKSDSVYRVDEIVLTNKWRLSIRAPATQFVSASTGNMFLFSDAGTYGEDIDIELQAISGESSNHGHLLEIQTLVSGLFVDIKHVQMASPTASFVNCDAPVNANAQIYFSVINAGRLYMNTAASVQAIRIIGDTDVDREGAGLTIKGRAWWGVQDTPASGTEARLIKIENRSSSLPSLFNEIIIDIPGIEAADAGFAEIRGCSGINFMPYRSYDHDQGTLGGITQDMVVITRYSTTGISSGTVTMNSPGRHGGTLIGTARDIFFSWCNKPVVINPVSDIPSNQFYINYGDNVAARIGGLNLLEAGTTNLATLG